MESEEYKAGRKAYEEGTPSALNPYGFSTTQRNDWKRGWFAAERDDKAADAPVPGRGSRFTLNEYAVAVFKSNAHWWRDPATGEPVERNKGELLMLIVSEIAEAMEGERKNLMDDKLPHRPMAEVELADALIRIFDYAGKFGYDLDGAFWEKRAFNATRADHKAEARLAADGKKW